MQQTSFLEKQDLRCGGELSLGKRKARRILDSKRAIHMVLRSKRNHLFKNKAIILSILSKQAQAKGVKIHKMSVQTNHIHLVIRIHSRKFYLEFIRAVTGLIARKLGKGLWMLLPFTRIISTWGKDYRAACDYVFQNEMEVQGVWQYKPRKKR